jgi:polysaccharide biosynthesis protein PslH
MTTKPSLLYITPVLPESGASGGLIVTLERLEILSRRFEITVLAVEATDAAIVQNTAKFALREVLHDGKVRPRTTVGWIKSIAAGYPFAIWRNMDADFLRLAEQAAGSPFVLTYVDHWLMWPAAQRIKSPGRRILQLHNAEHLLFSRAAKQASFPLRQVLGIEACRAKDYLRSICQEADEIHFLSDADAHEVRGLGDITQPSNVFLPWVPLDEGSYGMFGRNLLFVGTMSWAPNAEGACWYRDEIVPRLPVGYQTHIAGGYIHGVEPINTDSLVWHGRVPDLTALYRDAGVFVAPLLSGSGIKMKILNALSRGLPVVTTSLGAEGFPPGWEESVSVADTPEAFVAAIERLCNDRDAWEQARGAARVYMARHFSPKAFIQWTDQNA